MPSSDDWQLAGFLERLDVWADQEAADDDLRLVVTAWVLSRYDDPYRGVRRETGTANLWYAVVPDTMHDGRVVVCSYWINEGSRTLVCSSFASLTLPL